MTLTSPISSRMPSEQSKNLEIFADFGKCVSNSFKSGVNPNSSEVGSAFIVSFAMPLLCEF